jgi:hypothetical protein
LLKYAITALAAAALVTTVGVALTASTLTASATADEKQWDCNTVLESTVPVNQVTVRTGRDREHDRNPARSTSSTATECQFMWVDDF